MDSRIKSAFRISFDMPPEQAVKHLETLGIETTWDWKEQLEAVRKHAFTVAKVTRADILQMMLDELNRAMDEGIPFEEFKSNLGPLLQQKGYAKREDGTAWRLDTIYRTNMQSAYMAGRWKEMKEAADSFPYWEFIAVTDNRTTDGCMALNGVVLDSNHSFWKENYPPRHYRCRSRVRAVNETQMKRRGLRVTPDSKVAKVKPAKGFDSNPGEWTPDTDKYDSNIKEALDNIMGAYK